MKNVNVDLILSIVNKLRVEGITKANYTTYLAKKVLNKCVAPTILNKYLVTYRTSIVSQLK